MPWRLIPIDIPPVKHRWKKFLKKLDDNGGNAQEPSGGSSQSTEGSPTPERILKKNIMPNGAENITVVVFNKGNPPTNTSCSSSSKSTDRKEKSRKVRRISNDVQSPDSTSSSRPSHSLDNLPSSYQRSNLTERHDRTSGHERPSSHDRLSNHERSSHSRKDRRSWNEDRGGRETSKTRHSDPGNPPLRPWFRSHDMVEDYGRHRPAEELPQQYRSAYAANIRVSVDSNSPRKVYDDSYHGPTRHRKHSEEPKRTKTPYSRPPSAHTPAQDRLTKLEKHLKEERERKLSLEYGDKETSGSDAETKRRKTPPDGRVEKPENGKSLEIDDEEALEGVWQVKAEEINVKRNGFRQEDMMYSPVTEKSPTSSFERYPSSSGYDKKSEERSSNKNYRVSPSSDSKCSTDSVKSKSDERGSTSKESNKPSYRSSNLYKRKNKEPSTKIAAEEKLKDFAESLPMKRQRSTSPEMMDWEPVDTEVINSEIQELRKHGLVSYSCESSYNSPSSALNPNNYSMENKIFIVVDTNVMCTDIIKKVPNITLAGIDLVLYIPWQVLMELDALKLSKRGIARQAQRACSLLSDRSTLSSGRLHSQPPNMHQTVIDGFTPETPDDFILLSAMQLKSQGLSVILYTNDKNLMAKAEAAGVKKFSEVELSKIFNSKNRNSELVALENPPPESVKSPECFMAYRLALAFKNLLTKCLERLKEVRGNLWVLYMPILPPWNMVDTIKTARSSWDIICPGSTSDYKQMSLLNSIQFFLNDSTYDDISVEKLHVLFDECCTLATSLPVNLTQFADSFISQAKEILDDHFHGNDSSQFNAKLSDVDDLEDVNDEERASNIIDQFDVFSQKLLSFCGYVYRIKGIEWPTGDSNPGENNHFSEEFIRDFTPFAVSTLETIISSLSRLCSVEIGQVDSLTDGVGTIHKCLADFNGDRYKYSVKDVAAFANNPQVRANMNSGIVELRKLADIINKIV